MISMWQTKHVNNDVTIYHGVETSREPFPVFVYTKNTGSYFSGNWVKIKTSPVIAYLAELQPGSASLQMEGGQPSNLFEAKPINTDHKDLIHDVSYDFYGRRMATCSSDQSVKVIVESAQTFYSVYTNNMYE